MAKPAIYIDGQEGSTGLRIRELLGKRDDFDLRLIPESERKETDIRSSFLRAADLAILCLPDEAASEAIDLVSGADTRIIDTSTARRTHCDWVYGLPEMDPAQREAIHTADKVANPGCYPVGFILAVRPLIKAGILPAGVPLTVNAVSGYSGGGRRMIEAYQGAPASQTAAGDAPLPLALYNLDGPHKHVAEMQEFSLTMHPPIFVPSVDHTYSGMLVCTPIPAANLAADASAASICSVWNERYACEPFVRVISPREVSVSLRDGRFLDLGETNGTNCVDLFAFGDDRGVVLIGRQDNLGKGASGNAVQCMNLMLGFEESKGLTS